MRDQYLAEKLVIAAQQHKKEIRYWLQKLSGLPAKTSFSHDFMNTSDKKNERTFAVRTFRFTGELFSQLIKLSGGSDPRLHMTLVTGVMVLLHQYTNSNDILVGTPIYKQNLEGEFVNTVLPLRNRIYDGITFKELLLQVRQTISEAVANQSCPMEILLDRLNMPITNQQDDFPLFDTAVLVENIHERSYIRHINLNTTFSFRRTPHYIEGRLHYNRERYKKTSIERIIDHFENLFRQVLSNVNKQIADIDILSIKEKEQLLVEFNDTGAEYPREKTIHGLFEEQVEKAADSTAVVFAENQLTYGELNKKANQLARVLRKKRVGANGIAAVMLERSLEMIVGLLGILKAGSAYLPMDTDIPLKRVISILADSRAAILLTGTAVVKAHTFTALQTLRSSADEIHVTAGRSQILDFDSIPIPNRSLVDYEKYNQYIGQASMKDCIAIQASRGCPYKCLYCHKIWPKRHVVRTAEHILSEIQLYYHMGVRRFAFTDDIFNLDRKQSTRFFELVIKNNLDLVLSFPNGMRGDILTKEYIDLMVKAGVREMALALETASPRLQKLIKKNLNLESFRENLEYFCKKYPQVAIRLYTMVGFPSETEEEAMMTLDFIKSMKWLHLPFVFILKIFPGTDMEKLALENGVSREAIARSVNRAYHELPDTLPFDQSFVLKYQTDFYNNYFLSKERLMHVLPFQLKIYTEDELMQSYNSYLPNNINNFDELLQFFGITREEVGLERFIDPDSVQAPDLNRRLKDHFKPKTPTPDAGALRVLLLDWSMVFGSDEDRFADTNEPPLGLMYLLTYLYRQQGSSIDGKIGKTRMDFDNYQELKTFINEFKPDVIGIRTLSMYQEFFHQSAAMIRQWGIDVPIITGGPYATSSFKTILQDKNIDVVVIGEGEITFNQLIEKIRENNKKLPGEEVLKNINGIAFNPANLKARKMFQQETLLIDAITDQLDQEPHIDLTPQNQPGDLAYVIYTSGTTGKPKGVLIEHRNVVRLMFNDNYPFNFSSRDAWTMCHSYSFDFSVWEMYGALLYGGRLVLIPKIVSIDPEAFTHLLETQAITVLNQTPSAFFNFVRQLVKQRKKLNIKYVIFGGEALSPIKLKEWVQIYPQVKLINMFGITETTVHVTFKEIGPTEISLNASNVGKPIPTLSTYITDKNLKLKPLGGIGEISVGGEGVGRGYLNRPQLTTERFMENPYKPGERLYRSGDLARRSDNGEIGYLGRIDHQVKIRGYRIELEEIESQLMNYPDIKKAVAAAREEGEEKYLCAYFTAEKQIPIPRLKQYLLNRLPEYMVPLHFVQLDKIPLTTQGKVNKKALPEPVIQVTEEYIAPRNEIEEKIAAIWAEVLKIEKNAVSIDADFFQLGGHSLKMTLMLSKVQDLIKVKIPLNDIFQTPTIRKIAGYFEKDEIDIFADKPDNLVLLRKGTTSKNLFLIHGGSGVVDEYIELSDLINPEFSCWGINPNPIANSTPRNYTLEEIAREYLDMIKSIQPTGPYFIAGWCFGGTVAFEMVRQLEQEKEKIAFLALLNSHEPHEKFLKNVHQFTVSLEAELQWLQFHFSEVKIENQLKNIKQLNQLWPSVIDYLESIHYDVQLIKESVKHVKRDIPNFDQLNLRELIYRLNLSRSLDNARKRYMPINKVNQFIHFFIGTRSPLADKKPWADYCSGQVKYYQIAGDIFSVLEMPEVLQLAHVFNQALTEAIRASTRKNDREQDENFVKLRVGTHPQKNLFLVHAGSGEVEDYIELCQHTSPEFNCWGIKADPLENYTPKNITIELLVRKYILKMTKIQPQGPYFLAGWCIGGTIAFEMALQLEQRKEKIAFLALINASPPRASRPGREVPFEFTTEYEVNWLKKCPALHYPDLQPSPSTPLNRLWPEILDYWQGKNPDIELVKGIIPENIKQAIPNIQHLDLRQLIYYFNLGRSLDRARNNYIPSRKLESKVYFFLASRALGNRQKSWKEFCSRPLGYTKIKGDHFSMLKMPGVLEMAEEWNNQLEKCDRQYRQQTQVQPQSTLMADAEPDPEIKKTHQRLSFTSMQFLEYVKINPEALAASHYKGLELNNDLFQLQPWPTFIDQRLKKEIEDVSLGLGNLIKSIPQRLFNLDPLEISRYFEMPLAMVKTQLGGVTPRHLDNLLGRGDFLLASTGFKVLEYNFTASLGGWAVPYWESLYLEVPVIAQFLLDQEIRFTNSNLMSKLLDHIIRQARAALVGPDLEINTILLMVGENPEKEIHSSDIILNELYKKQLKLHDRRLKGTVASCYPRQLSFNNGKVYWQEKQVHAIVEMAHGIVPTEITTSFKKGNICLYNGPITGLMSNKLTLALLSEQENSRVFTSAERKLIRESIPWTRKIIPGTTTYQGTSVNLKDFILSHKDRLVMKPGIGFGGYGVYVGRNTPPAQWETVYEKALQEKSWLVQEFVESVPYLYQWEENTCAPHDAVWGFFVLGPQYGGGWVRVMPRGHQSGVINCHQGAKVSVIFEVAE